ncbi:hypothetical protein [Microvirga subterranea]|uniref:DUF4148 domain-containing protein n=1 Tax=Microvirga subterranea TaxID=186651 RepID=A0A370HJ41_9HYPH|nr:hypothetical protein [Microvirga subterranea]RDI57780.1 hypothetical protein DES45_10692 [Microvirga subterranea]
MQRCLWLAILGSLITAVPASAQDRKGPHMSSGEIRVPSDAAIEKMLEGKSVPNPANEFSGNDSIATQQMDRQDRQIDREVEKGICSGC